METEYNNISDNLNDFTNVESLARVDDTFERQNNEALINNREVQQRILIEHNDNPLYESLKNRLINNIDTSENILFHDRNKSTYINPKPSTEVLKIIDDVVTNYIINKQSKEQKELTLIDLNNYIYAVAITVKEHLGQLQEKKRINTKKKPELPHWLNNIQISINKIRRLIGHIVTISNCKETNQFTPKQCTIKNNLHKKFGNTKQATLEHHLCRLKHNLKAKATKFRYQKNIIETKRLNKKFSLNPKSVYRTMKGNNIDIKEAPTQDNIEKYWGNIWGHHVDYNKEAPWLKELERNYCSETIQKSYKIDDKLLSKVINKIQNGKSPGPDGIIGYWYKSLNFYRPYMTSLFQQALEGQYDIPSEIVLARTVLIPKNNNTIDPKNYRPIACLNLMYKLYTSCLNQLIQDHCEYNNIITDEQAAGKKGVWGCAEQLLVNKGILKEVRKQKRNLYTVWLDYAKAFDSVPHSWLFDSMRLAKVPKNLISAIEKLSKIWATNVVLKTNDINISTEKINYHKGILQGDSLSVILFILSVNPLSHILKQMKGYSAGKNRTTNISHNFFVDDLKLYNSSLSGIQKQLDIVTNFSNDIGMKFGQDKCAYLNIVRGKMKNDDSPLEMNGLIIQQIKDGDCYRYLGQDENISYVGKINKDRIISEYVSRVKKIWKSRLSAFNKSIAHNTFAVPVLVPTYGILDWTIEELKSLDVKTRKILSMSGSFHINSDADCLYVSRSEGGRGLKSIKASFESRIISLNQHIVNNKNRNHIMNFINESEEMNIQRVSNELLTKHDIVPSEREHPRSISKKYSRAENSLRIAAYKQKIMHGYIQRQIEKNDNIDQGISKSWTKNKYMTSQFEAYAFAIKDQEISTKYIKSKRANDNNVINSKCRLCKNAVEDITHIIASCPMMSARYYLPVRHDVVAKTVYNALIKRQSLESKIKDFDSPEYIRKENDTEFWWNVSIETATKLQHNKPDLVIWNRTEKTCLVLEFSCPADINVVRKVEEKVLTYGPLIRNLQIMYKDYRFKMLPIIVGALGTIPKATQNSLKELDFSNKDINALIRKLQQYAIKGTVQICKTFMRFSEN